MILIKSISGLLELSRPSGRAEKCIKAKWFSQRVNTVKLWNARDETREGAIPGRVPETRREDGGRLDAPLNLDGQA